MLKRANTSKFIRQLSGFGLAGGLATSLHWATMATLIWVGFSAAFATAIGSAVGAVANFRLQGDIAFPQSQRDRSTLLRYLFACGLAWVSNLLCFLGFQHCGCTTEVAQALATGCVTAQNFFIYKLMVFHEYSDSENCPAE